MPCGSPPYALCSRLLVAGFAFGLVWNFNDVNFGVGPPESPTTVPMAGQLDSSKLLRRRQKLSSRRGGGIGGTALQWAVCPPCPESAVAGSPDITSREAYANKTWARTSSFSSAGWSPATVTVTVCVVGFQRVPGKNDGGNTDRLGDMSTVSSFDDLTEAQGERMLVSLPVRSPECPYVLPLPTMMRCKVPDPLTNPSGTRCSRRYVNELLKRQATVGDVQFFAEDLTEHIMCSNWPESRLAGVALPPPHGYNSTRRDHTAASFAPGGRRNFLAYAGTCKAAHCKYGCAHSVRSNMAAYLVDTGRRLHEVAGSAVDYGFREVELTNRTGITAAKVFGDAETGWRGFHAPGGGTFMPSVNMSVCVSDAPRRGCIRLLCTQMQDHWGARYPGLDQKEAFTDLVSDSVFALVPRGDNRWSYRFSETLAACTIPVVIADGLSLPFEELIDWSTAAVFVPEKEVHRILDFLPPVSEQRAMMQAVCDIHRRFFSTEAARASAFEAAMALRITRNVSRPSGWPRPLGAPSDGDGNATVAGMSLVPKWYHPAEDRSNPWNGNRWGGLAVLPNGTYWLVSEMKNRTDYVTAAWVTNLLATTVP